MIDVKKIIKLFVLNVFLFGQLLNFVPYFAQASDYSVTLGLPISTISAGKLCENENGCYCEEAISANYIKIGSYCKQSFSDQKFVRLLNGDFWVSLYPSSRRYQGAGYYGISNENIRYSGDVVYNNTQPLTSVLQSLTFIETITGSSYTNNDDSRYITSIAGISNLKNLEKLNLAGISTRYLYSNPSESSYINNVNGIQNLTGLKEIIFPNEVISGCVDLSGSNCSQILTDTGSLTSDLYIFAGSGNKQYIDFADGRYTFDTTDISENSSILVSKRCGTGTFTGTTYPDIKYPFTGYREPESTVPVSYTGTEYVYNASLSCLSGVSVIKNETRYCNAGYVLSGSSCVLDYETQTTVQDDRINVRPDYRVGKTATNYKFSIRYNSGDIALGDKIVASFPSSFMTNLVDTGTNQDINKYNLSGVEYSKFIFSKTGTRDIEIVFTTGYVDYLNSKGITNFDFKINGIGNPSTATAQDFAVRIFHIGSDGIYKHKVLKYINILPDFSSSNSRRYAVNLLDQDGNSTIFSGTVVHIKGDEGILDIMGNSTGTAYFSGYAGRFYSIWMEPYITIGSQKYIFDANPYSVYVYPVLTRLNTLDIQLKRYQASDFINISGDIKGYQGKSIKIVAISDNQGIIEKNLGILTSNVQSWTMEIPKNFGKTSISMQYSVDSPDNNIPLVKSQYIRAREDDVAGVDFDAGTLNLVSFVVKDQNNIEIVDALISVSATNGAYDTLNLKTNFSGNSITYLQNGAYTYIARLDGSSQSVSQKFNVKDSEKNINIVLKNTNKYYLTGIVYNSGDSSKIGNVYVMAYNVLNGSNVNTMSDGNGNYKLYLDRGTWKLDIGLKGYGIVYTENVVVNADSNKDFYVDLDNGRYVYTGVVILSGGAGLSGSVIKVENLNDLKDIYSINTDNSGNYRLYLKNGTYVLSVYHPQYGFIGQKNFVVAGSDGSIDDFVVNTTHTLNIVLSGDISNVPKLKWSVNLEDSSSKKFINKIQIGYTGLQIDNIQDGIYSLKINVFGIGEVFSSGTYLINFNLLQNITLNSSNALVSVNGTLNDLSGNVLSDAVVDAISKDNNLHFGMQTSLTGTFQMMLKPGNYDFVFRKNGYAPKILNSIIISSGGKTFGISEIQMTQIDDSQKIIITGTVASSSGSLDLGGIAFASLQGITSTGDFTKDWYGMKVNQNSQFSFEIPKDKNWRLVIGADGHQRYSQIFSGLDVGTSVNITLVYTGNISQGQTDIIDPSQGGIIENKGAGVSLTLPALALGGSSDLSNIITKSTSGLPEVGNFLPVDGGAVDIILNDNEGNLITDLNNYITIKLSYTGASIVASNTGITVDDIRNLHIYYYDEALGSWMILPTIVNVSGISDFDSLTGTLLFSSVSGYANSIITLTANTNHFTLFTSLVSSVVSNSSSSDASSSSSSPGGGVTTVSGGGGSSGGGGGGFSSSSSSSASDSSTGTATVSSSLTSGITKTTQKVSDYLGGATQSVIAIGGKDINSILTIKRNGKTISLSTVLSNSADKVSGLGKNLVDFAAGDILQTSKEGSIQFSLDGYTKLNINPGSALKISAIGKDFLTYENVRGTIEYKFEKTAVTNVKYEVKGNVSYATIRGTTLKVITDSAKEEYDLIEGKIDVYNSILKKSVTLNAGEKYIVYLNGKEQFVSTNGTVSNTSTNTVVEAEALNAAKSLYSKGITKLTSDKTDFYGNLTRWESALLLGRYASKILGRTNIKDSCAFSDLGGIDLATKNEIGTACKLGLFKGSNGKFMPNNMATRGQLIMVVARMLSKNPDLEVDKSYDYLLEKKIIKVDDRKTSRRNINRYELYIMLYRMMNSGV